MRQIVTKKNIDAIKKSLPKAQGETLTEDTYQDKILKYIPAEVVALYVAAYGIAETARKGIPFEIIIWVLFAVGIVATIAYLRRIAKVNDWSQIAISAVAFAVWVFAIGGPFKETQPWYRDAYGTLLLLIYTFFIPVIAGK
jgi:hypothetical protein